MTSHMLLTRLLAAKGGEDTAACRALIANVTTSMGPLRHRGRISSWVLALLAMPMIGANQQLNGLVLF